MTGHYAIATPRLLLRTFEEEDVGDTYVQWLNDPEVNRFLEAKHTTWTKDLCRDYVRSCLATDDRHLFGIYDKDTREYIGNASVNNIETSVSTFSLGLFIGNRDYWGGSTGSEATLAMLYLGFDLLRLRKFFGGAYSNQIASRFILKRIGCVEEAKLKEKYKFEDRYVDQVIYTMTQEQWANKGHRQSIHALDWNSV